jgi:O-antigen/teichoic acid export membrane protein
MALKANVVANFVGQAWRAVLQLAFVPLYIRYLGLESYGLIGAFAVLQAWLSLLDMGLRPALSREMARFAGGDQDTSQLRDLLRTVELGGLATAAVVLIGVWSASGWLAESWLSARTLPPEVTSPAITIMGAVSALAFIESIYVSSIIGLQRQVAHNIATSAIATVRYLGVIGVLAWVSPTIQAYFLWQVVISILSVCVLAILVYRTLPGIGRSARFSFEALLSVWKFAGGMIGITLLSLLLTQVDKTLLTKLLPLEEFAYYALACNVTTTLYMLVAPITTAFYPRLTQLVSKGDTQLLAHTYHQGAQLLTVLLAPAALMLILFGDRILLLWTGDPKLTANVAPLLQVMACGTLLHGLMWMPYHLQLAYGWTSLSIKINVVAVVFLLPAILLTVPGYGAIGAAWVWVLLNVGYVVLGISLMHTRLLPEEKWRWYREDVVLPLGGALLVAFVLRGLPPAFDSKPLEMALTLLHSLCLLAVGTLLAPIVRQSAWRSVATWRTSGLRPI